MAARYAAQLARKGFIANGRRPGEHPSMKIKLKIMLGFLVALVAALSLLAPLYSKEVMSPIVTEAEPIVVTEPQTTDPEAIKTEAPVVPAPPVAPVPVRTSDEINEENVWLAINEKRVELGLKPLAVDARLTKTAEFKSWDMANRDYFSHTNPEGDKIWKTVIADGYSYQYVGENLALYHTSLAALMDAWLLSPKHRENILSEHYVDLGVGVATDENGYIYVTTLFGRE